jgi:hypothetical protein
MYASRPSGDNLAARQPEALVFMPFEAEGIAPKATP